MLNGNGQTALAIVAYKNATTNNKYHNKKKNKI